MQITTYVLKSYERQEAINSKNNPLQTDLIRTLLSTIASSQIISTLAIIL